MPKGADSRRESTANTLMVGRVSGGTCVPVRPLLSSIFSYTRTSSSTLRL